MTARVSMGALLMTAMLASAADTRLADAAEKSDRNAVRALLAQHVDVNAPQGDGTTALHWAAFNDDLEMAKMLVAAGASVKAVTRDGAITPLFMACKNGDAAMTELLLKAGADPGSIDGHGTTALMMAAASGSAETVKVLVEHGADVNAKEGAHGQTALMFAAAVNRAAAITTLLEYRADPGVTTKAVKLPKPRSRFEDGSLVPDEPAAKEARPGQGGGGGPEADKAALDALAAAMGLKGAVYTPGGKPGEGDLKDLMQKLTAKVDSIEKRLPEEKKPEGAANVGGGGRGGGNNGFGVIRERGTTDMGGMTALLFAARDGQIDAVRALLDGGADINQVSPTEKTSPLVMAIMNAHLDLAKLLVDWGADPNLSNTQGLTALYATIDVQWAPKGWFPEPTTSQESVTYLSLMKTLLEDGADPNTRIAKKLWFRSFGDHSWTDPSGATAFWRAASSTDVAAMKMLVAYDANPDIPTLGGTTPLMAAAGVGWGYHFSMNSPDFTWMDAVKYCVQLGADVNAADARGYTALHGAAYIGNDELVDYLVERGADVKAVAKDKNTVADMANGPTRFGIPHPETVVLLEKLGSANSHNCRSDQCLVAPKPDRNRAAPGTVVTPTVAAPASATPPAPAAPTPAAPAAGKKTG